MRNDYRISSITDRRSEELKVHFDDLFSHPCFVKTNALFATIGILTVYCSFSELVFILI